MQTVRCPQCSAAIATGSEHCPQCGYPLGWQAGRDDRPAPDGDHMVRMPGEPGGGSQTTRLTGTPQRGGAGRSTPAPTGSSGPTVTCPSCGASNPADRTLCQRCAAGLSRSGPPVKDRTAWWRGRIGWLLLAVVLGAIVTTLVWLWSSAEVTDAAQPADGASAAANAASEVAGAEILLERGDTGDEVARWQELLRSAGIDLQADGKYGPQTEAATRRFQKTLGEEPTGQVTTHTMDAAERLSSFDVLDVHFVRDGDLEAVRRRVDRTALARGVLRALLAAPLQAERDDGLSTAIPPATAVHSLEVDGGVASIELSGFAEEPDEAMRVRVDQVVRTLTQFDAVDAVLFVLPPEDARAFAEAGVTLGEPVRGGDG